MKVDLFFALPSRGLVEIFDTVTADGSVIRQDASLSHKARRAMSLLCEMSIEAGLDLDPGSSIHEVMELARRLFAEWGIPQFAPPFKYAKCPSSD